MFDEYRIIELDQEELNFKVKFRFLVMKFCGATAKQKPIYRLCRQERTLERAQQYIADHSKG